ncbi:aminoglycoside phosphotransferase family protein [Saccharothrix syringae]|uniref:Aminoglycoside phosphotransferase n=1 Tax=Saccharothrix syringae TaxID=103733 RepID=A0A5Q0H2K0_SACSY|nr:aminoglycoside phosphotransferase family protein [Saccharothrix syringae]QFZ20050.1 aminoglycoside phosphotransferase [Saccharothrix syringae]
MVGVDGGLAGRMARRFGEGVRPWLEGLPALVAELCARWGLEVEGPLSGGTSHALRCRRAGVPVVLKLTPEPALAQAERAALRVWGPSPRVVRVLEADTARGALLLEGLVPGTPAADGPGLLEVLRALHVPAPEGFPPLAQRVDFVFGLLARRHPGDHSRAHAEASRLARDRVPRVLLHGDLHPANVLDAGPRGLVVIDPRACVGDAACDAVDFAYLGPDLRARIEWLSAVVDGDRLAAWCRVFAAFHPDHPAVRSA